MVQFPSDFTEEDYRKTLEFFKNNIERLEKAAKALAAISIKIKEETIKRCETCKWYKVPEQLGFEKDCSCPKMKYGYAPKDDKPDEVIIEDDVGWGMSPGPKFGCIHHKEKQ